MPKKTSAGGDAGSAGKSATMGVISDPPQTPTRCDEGGGEMVFGIISLHQGEPVDLNLVLCLSAFDLRVFLDDKVLFAQVVQNGINLTLPPLAPGLHSLTWTFIAASKPWKVRNEVLVSGLVRFRMRKSDPGSTMASNNLALLLEVV